MQSYPQDQVTNFDKLTYAGNLANLRAVEHHPGYSFFHGDICDLGALMEAMPQGIDAVVHFAAESHLDRRINGAAEFVATNVLDTQITPRRFPQSQGWPVLPYLHR